MKTYTPSPLNAENITLPDNLTELTEAMARNVHEVWALGRVKEGWKYGETRNDELKTHPGLVPYEELPDSDREWWSGHCYSPRYYPFLHDHSRSLPSGNGSRLLRK